MVRMLHAPLGFQPQGAMLADMDLSEEGEVTRRLRKRKRCSRRCGAFQV